MSYLNKKITEEHKIKMYNKILNRIHKKIKYASRQRETDNFVVVFYLNLF